MNPRLLRGGLALAALAAGSTLAGTVDAPPASAEPECLTESYDFNRDGNTDYAAGLPGADTSAGAVEVALSLDDLHEPVRVQPAGLRPGDEFGAAIAEVAYYENEGDDERCSQLVVGAPGRDVDGEKDAGSVFLFAFQDGEFTLVKEFVQGSDGIPGRPTAGARFGASLTAPFHGDDTGPVVTPLYVGAPGATVGDATDAGEVVRLKLGGDDPTATEAVTIRQGADGVPGTPEAGDAFGSSLALVDDGLVAGAPGENDDAGGVVHWVAADPSESRFVTQNSSGVPGTAESGDRFGAALAATPALPGGTGGHVLVGAPGEAIGTLRSAGSVIVFDDALSPRGVKGYNQDTPGIAGTAEAGDRFGASVATFGAKDLVAGAPGEDVGPLQDAGAVSSLTRNTSWSQNSPDIPGTAEAGDRFGATLANPTVPRSDESRFWPSPLVGAPGENDGAGLVYYGVVGDGLARETWVQADPRPGDAFGAAVGKVN